MKNLNVAIPDAVDQQLDWIMAQKQFRNRSDAIEWIIREVFKTLQGVQP